MRRHRNRGSWCALRDEPGGCPRCWPGGVRRRGGVSLVCDPATLVVAWSRVSRNRGSRTAGVDAATRRHVEARGVEQFLIELREELRAGTFRPLPVRERLIPKRGGKRRLGIPTVIAYPKVAQAGFGFVGCHPSVSSAARRAVGGAVRSSYRHGSYLRVRGRAIGERVAAGECDRSWPGAG